MADQKLNVIVSLVDNLTSGLNGISKKLKDHEKTFKSMQKVGTIAFASIAAGVGLSLKAYAESEAQLARVDTILGTLGEDTMKQFSGGLDQAKTIAREFGDEMQQLGGISGELASESFAKLLQVTGDSSQAMEMTALAADLATAKQVDLDTATKAIIKTMNGSNKELSALGIVMDEHATKEETMAALAKAVSGQYEAYGKTLAGQTAIMKEGFGDLTESIGKGFAPILQKVNEFLIPLIEKFTKWAEENPKLMTTIVLVIGALAGLVAIAGTLGLVLPVLIAGFTAIGAALAVIFSPIGLIIAAITALVAALIWLWNNSEEVNQYIMASLQVLADFFIGIWETIKQTFIDNWNAMAEFFAEIWTAIATPFIAGLTFIGNLWTMVWTNASLLFTTVWEAMKAGGTAAIDWFVALFGAAVDKIGAAFGAIWEGAKGVMLGIFESIKGAIVSVFNWIIGKMNSLISKFNSLVIGGINKLPGVELKEMPKIPLLAEGGIVTRPTLAMIGEGGEPEAVIPLSKMNQGRSIIINISGNTLLDERAGAKIGDMIIKRLRPNASF